MIEAREDIEARRMALVTEVDKLSFFIFGPNNHEYDRLPYKRKDLLNQKLHALRALTLVLEQELSAS